jgi:hypothetical protein
MLALPTLPTTVRLQLYDRFAAIAASLVEIAVKLDCLALTMLFPKRKVQRAAGPRSSQSSERRKSRQIWLRRAKVAEALRVLHHHQNMAEPRTS